MALSVTQATSVAVTFDASPDITVTGLTSGADVLVLIVYGTTETISSVTDNNGGGSNTYSSIFSGTDYIKSFNAYLAQNVGSGATSITVTFSGTTFGSIFVFELAGGVNETTPLADSLSAQDSGFDTTWNLGTVTPTEADSFVACVCLDRAEAGGTTWTVDGTLTALGANPSELICGYEAGVAASAQTMSGTLSASANYDGWAIAIDAAAASGGALPLISPYGSGLIST